MRRRLTWLDVFTDIPLVGNQLAVVHDADGLADETMLAFARETRLSETTFVQSPGEPGADYRIRIFSPPGELPFAGHPSLGTAVAVARVRGQSKVRYVQQTRAGLQPVEVQRDGDHAQASMLQEPPRFGARPSPADVLAAAGLPISAGDPQLEPQVVSTGFAHLMIPLKDRAALAAAAPMRDAMSALLEPIDAMVLYLAAIDIDARVAHARGFFVDPAGVTEDPATGSAAGPLLAYLHERDGIDELVVHQGIEMGRPSRIDCAWADDRPRVSGAVVVIADGHVSLDG
ncbi:MAG TPA: PhzF family phenazine biosynthesis protein [Solirubrobacteraceae bacterium]|nr:PhzF family phenazine biosynthesis protein [Solirubrobacteraceae bacterium]